MKRDAMDVEAALYQFALYIESHIGNRTSKGRFIRDVFGRISFVAPKDITKDEQALLQTGDVGPAKFYVDETQPFVFPESEFAADLLNEHGQAYQSVNGTQFIVLDRRIAGEDWLQIPRAPVNNPPRFAFYGLKGGVGRSTALAIAAADLASRGKNVLVVDLDLEAPGLGSILLREDRLPEYGVLDYLANEAAGIDARSLVPDMVGGSSFTTGGGVVDVVPAAGTSTLRYPSGFFAKLSRAYTPGAARGRLVGMGFTEKIELMLRDLSEHRPYDAVLIDVRAGLHETAAASLLALGAYVFMFGVSSSQTITDFRILLLAIRQSLLSWPSAPDIRGQFRMVQGRAPSALGDHALYRVDSWKLWLETLYDAVGDEPDAEAFSFDVDDPQGPHYPWVIQNAEAFLTFDPQRSDSHLDVAVYGAVFGTFLSNLYRMIDEA